MLVWCVVFLHSVNIHKWVRTCTPTRTIHCACALNINIHEWVCARLNHTHQPHPMYSNSSHFVSFSLSHRPGMTCRSSLPGHSRMVWLLIVISLFLLQQSAAQIGRWLYSYILLTFKYFFWLSFHSSSIRCTCSSGLICSVQLPSHFV